MSEETKGILWIISLAWAFVVLLAVAAIYSFKSGSPWVFGALAILCVVVLVSATLTTRESLMILLERALDSCFGREDFVCTCGLFRVYISTFSDSKGDELVVVAEKLNGKVPFSTDPWHRVSVSVWGALRFLVNKRLRKDLQLASKI